MKQKGIGSTHLVYIIVSRAIISNMPPEQQSSPLQSPQQPSLYPTQPTVSPFSPSPPPPPKPHKPWALIIPLVFFVILFLATAGIASQIAAQRDDYKNNVKQKVAVAVTAAKQETEKKDEVAFLEREKSPYRTYEGPSAFGSINIQYPKTWSAAVSEVDKGSEPVNGFFHPSVVPDPKSGTGFALHLEVVTTSYDRALNSFQSAVKRGEVRISPYIAPKVPGVLGARVDGAVVKDHQGSMVLFPLRDKTIRLTTLSPQFVPDFNNIILENLVFTP